MLLAIEPGLILNTDTIRSIKEVPATSNRGERAEIVFTDGTRTIANCRIDDIEWCAGPIIPAPSGYSVIRAFEPEQDGDATEFATYPVLAFRLTRDEPVPIVPFGKLGDASWALVWPDGRCDEMWNRLFPSVDAFKASFGSKGVRS